MEYYIEGNPDKADQIDNFFTSNGYTTYDLSFTNKRALYFTVKGYERVRCCDINSTMADVLRSTEACYKHIELPKFKVGDVLQDTRFSPRLSPVTVHDIDFEKERYVVLDKEGDKVLITFSSIHKFYDYYNEKEVTLPFEAGDLVLVRDTDNHKWKVNVFSHMTPYEDYKFACAGGIYNQCIPFKENKHLVGTSQKCCKQYPPICYGKT